MKKIFAILFALIFLVGFVIAEEEPKYNFGSMQAAKEFILSPGEMTETKLYFYNIYGNRITHIKLTVENAPKNWQVEIEPAAKDVQIEVAGVLTTVNENFNVEPSQPVATIPTDVPEYTEYITGPGIDGYIKAKVATIKIRVPENEKVGRNFRITIDASAEWLGQTGAVAVKQGRSFDYTVRTVAEEFYEKILEEPEVEEVEEEVPEEVKEVPIAGAAVKEIEKRAVALKEILIIITILAALVIVFSFIVLKREKKF